MAEILYLEGEEILVPEDTIEYPSEPVVPDPYTPDGNTVRLQNLTRKREVNVKEGTVFELCNFAQDAPETDIGLPDIDLTFRQCNMARVKKMRNWKYEGCTVTQEPIVEETQEAVDKAQAVQLARELDEIIKRTASAADEIKDYFVVAVEVKK